MKKKGEKKRRGRGFNTQWRTRRAVLLDAIIQGGKILVGQQRTGLKRWVDNQKKRKDSTYVHVSIQE